ncbi:MAG: ribosomal RNA small subunit methyltransferase A [Phycisphaerales bacterium]|nr:MAG: ribosomal RNA small subunit methyltransferase A [Phycisphaerales bacterium]
MQTKQQIQHLLASAGISVNRRLGQHFLIDLNLMRLLVASSGIRKNDIVLEVGCGTGSLTEALAQDAGKVIAVELDGHLAELAKARLAGLENLAIIHTDILANKKTISRTVIDALKLSRAKHAGRILLVANLPYNVASPVILNLLKGPMVADAMYVTVQREVADRMTAGPGGGEYGTLGVFLGAIGQAKTIRTLKPTVFWPQPEVDSAMVSFVRSGEKAGRIRDMQLFGETVSLFMGHRRKMVKSCTKFATGRLAKITDWPQVFERCCIDPTRRPQQLSPEEYIAMANLCSGWA